jgi:hypothetical protein
VNAKGTVLAATTGQQFSGIVATFTDTNANAVPGSFTATIDWDDGTTSTGTVSVDPKGGFDISGMHTYAPSSEAALGFPFGGSLQDLLGGRFFVVTVTIQDSTTSAAATVLSLAKVAAAPPVITVQGQNISASAGQSFSGVVAKFNAANTSATAGDFTATIHWGDGTSSTGSIVADPNGGFDVTGSHTYTDANDWFGFPDGWGVHFSPGSRHFLISVTVTDTQTQDRATAESLATVAAVAPNLFVTAQNLTATSGQTFSGLVATFTDANTSATAGSFTATINWGDGTTSAGVITADPKGGFHVSGTHTYTLTNIQARLWGGSEFDQDDNVFPFTVTVKSTTNSDAGTTQALASVTPASAKVQASGTVLTAVFNQPFSRTVATFIPTSTNASATDFTATIEWGDGTTSTGTIVADANGGFDVTGSHTYGSLDGGHVHSGRDNGNGLGSGREAFLVGVTIVNTTNNGIAEAVSLASVTPTPPSIVATAVSLNVTSGTTFSGTVASFTDSDNKGTAHFQATIAWGDGTISAGTVSANANGGYTVGGTHTYKYGGTYRILVKIRDADGNSALGVGTATVDGNVTPTTLFPVALAFLQSAEYYTDLIVQDYQQLLGRTAGKAEIAGWVNAMQHGVTDTQVMVGFLSSQEYYGRAGNDAKAWVDALYRNVLGRTADSGGESTWTQTLSTGVSRANVALDFITSQEHDALVVRNDYQHYLNRAAGSTEISGWVNAMQHGATSGQIIADFLGSQEYFQGHNASAGDWLSSVYQNVLSRQADQSGYDSWLGVLAANR